ncbi:hypothetical protein ACH47B_06700 [Rhodococcus sp. NPDC019627]|uniref:hypothetical protein n=1 Tax=unclassified Rhodococcus (in: high G+C Gram-positive bacteria) TaxID=192944 RepID=UPI0037A13947
MTVREVPGGFVGTSDTGPAFVPFERAMDRAGGDTPESSAICRRAEFRPTKADRITLWEGDADGEGWRAKRVRQEKAARLCGICPVRDACRAWLADVDRVGLTIDGVVAGEVRRWRYRRKQKPGPPAAS